MYGTRGSCHGSGRRQRSPPLMHNPTRRGERARVTSESTTRWQANCCQHAIARMCALTSGCRCRSVTPSRGVSLPRGCGGPPRAPGHATANAATSCPGRYCDGVACMRVADRFGAQRFDSKINLLTHANDRRLLWGCSTVLQFYSHKSQPWLF